MKPNVEIFRKVANKCRGHISNIAKTFEVNRVTVWLWVKNDPEFRDIIDECKGHLLDDCVHVATFVALGIPEKDNEGKITGWKERPDPNMLRYFIGTLGRREGYGESIDITSNGESIAPRTLSKEDIKEYIKSIEGEY